MIKYIIFRFLTVILPFTAYYITDFIACIAGYIIFRSGNWRIGAIQHNLETIGCKDADIRAIFTNMIINYIDFFKSFYMSKIKLVNITKMSCAFPDIPYVLLTGHFGNWEMGGIVLSAAGQNLVTIAESEGPGERMYELFKKMRSTTSMKVLRLEDKMIGMELNNAISNGHNPVLLMDRDITKTGIRVQMGSRNALIPKGPYYFAKKYGLRICIGTFRRIKDKRFRYICNVQSIDVTGKASNDAQNAINEFIRQIAAKPEEWFAFDINWEEKNEQ